MTSFFEIDDKIDNIRIDRYMMMKTSFSRSKIQKMIIDQYIKVNNEPVKNSYILKKGDLIRMAIPKIEVHDLKPVNIPLHIIYEDDDLLVVNKPKGMVVHPAKGHHNNTLVNALLYHCNQLSKVNQYTRPGIVHRLDKDTSGLLLVAKNDETHLKLAEAIKLKKVMRTYIALVAGVILNDKGTIDAPIGRDQKNRKKMAVTGFNSKQAVTYFKVIKRLKEATLIECKLETGRTHQIRVHLKYIKHPLINDPLYGNKKIIDNSGQLLHAKKIGFYHPKTNEYLEFTAPLPTSFVKIVDQFK